MYEYIVYCAVCMCMTGGIAVCWFFSLLGVTVNPSRDLANSPTLQAGSIGLLLIIALWIYEYREYLRERPLVGAVKGFFSVAGIWLWTDVSELL